MDPAVGLIDSAEALLTDLLKLFIAVAIVTHNQMRQHINVHRELISRFIPLFFKKLYISEQPSFLWL